MPSYSPDPPFRYGRKAGRCRAANICFYFLRFLKTSIAYLVEGKGKPPRSQLPKHGYRRDMMGRMQRLIATGMFDDLLPR